MSDTNDDDAGPRPPRGRPGPKRPQGERFRRPQGGERPARTRDDDRPRGKNDGAPFRKPREGGERPFRARPEGDRPGRSRKDGERPFSREAGDRPFRKPAGGGDRPFRARPEGDRPVRSRDEGERARPFSRDAGERPFRRPAGGDERPFRARDGRSAPSGAGERPFRKAPGGDDRPRRPPPAEAAAAAPPEPAEERIAKAIARAGIASRRDAEAMIAQGRVTLNGAVVDSPAINVTRDDRITVDGEPLPARERTRLWIFHKPRGFVTTARDPEGRPTVFEHLPEDLPRVVAIGRLDMNTEGLLLLTNDGGLAKVIAHPQTGWLRRYRVRAHGDVTQADLDRLRDGVTIDGMDYGPIEANLDRVQGDNVWMTMGLREGKNREVKRILEHLGLQVNRLIRLSFGPFQLGDLEPGLVEEVKTRVLKDQLGQKLAAEAGVDFESPVREPIAPFGPPPNPAPAREDSRGREQGERPRFGREREREDFARTRRHEPEERGPPPRERGGAPGRAPRSTVWRDDDESGERRGGKAPRRGADPKAARAAAGERPRERVGAIAAGERKVVVERLVSAPRPDAERPERRPRAADRDRPPRRQDDEQPLRPKSGRDPERPRASGPAPGFGRPRPGAARPIRGAPGGGAPGPRRGPPRGRKP